VHQLRVSVRRLRSILWLLRKDESFSPALDRSLRALGKALGSQRELDVAIQDAAKLHLSAPKLHRSQSSHQRSVRNRLRNRNDLLAKLAVFSRRLKQRQEVKAKAQLSALLATARKWRSKKLRGSAQLHRFRIKTKRLRYVLEAFGQNTKPLRELQDNLGRAHDLEVLGTLVGKKKVIVKKEKKNERRAKRLAGPALRLAAKELTSLQ
jgi:CHAD domain-containing protein